MLSRAVTALFLTASLALAQNGDKPGEKQESRVPKDKIPANPPLAPEAALKTFKLPPGFRIEIVAADPLIETPIAMQWDADGRLWVVEMPSYMNTPTAEGELNPINRVSVLEDTDGDGKMDKKTVFLDKLVMPRALCLAYGGVLVCEPPVLNFYPIEPGLKPGKAVLVDKNYAPNGIKNPEHTGNSPTWLMNNWIVSANHTLRFRRVDNEWKRSATTSRGQWGLTMDDWGRPYYNSNSDQHRVDLLPGHYLARNPNLRQPFGINVQMTPDQRTWPIRVNPGVNRGYQAGQLTPEGRLATFTGACGPVVYRGDQFPTNHVGDVFLCEPTANLIRHNMVLDRDGILSSTNAHVQSEFLASTDERFRPVNLANGPDGCLYIVDMARGLIQHHIYLTSYLRRQTEGRNLQSPIHLGRIYRVVHAGTPVRRRDILPAKPTLDEWLQRLSHPNGWWRDCAQQNLVLARQPESIPRLRGLCRPESGASALGRIHALWTLEGLSALTPALVRDVMKHPDPQIRIQAIRASESLYKAGDKSFAADYRVLAKDADVNVVIQAMLTANLMQIPESTALIRETLASSSARGVKEIGNQLLTPGRSMGQPASNDQSVGVLNLTVEQRRAMTQGQAVFREICFSCHGNDGRGTPIAGSTDGATLAPSLASSTRLAGHRDYVIQVLLKGLTGELDGKVYNGGGVMVPMGANTDEWIANVASFVRNSFGNTASFVTAEQVAAARAASASRTTPWTLAELEAQVPILLANQSEWKATASVNEAAAANALEAAAPVATAVPAAAPASAPRGGAGGGRGGAAPAARWDTGGAQQAGMWFQIELSQAANVAEVQLDTMATGGRGGGGGRGAAPVGGPVKYQGQVSADGTT